jgi:hypothetical protein
VEVAAADALADIAATPIAVSTPIGALLANTGDASQNKLTFTTATVSSATQVKYKFTLATAAAVGDTVVVTLPSFTGTNGAMTATKTGCGTSTFTAAGVLARSR